MKAHRYVYEQLVGPIPEGLQLDHLCHNRRCVNPRHLEPVTAAINLRRSGLYDDDTPARHCDRCGAALGGRADQRYCSGRCRTAAWRLSG